jgi:4'-phosphopantetheinyl transferase
MSLLEFTGHGPRKACVLHNGLEAAEKQCKIEDMPDHLNPAPDAPHVDLWLTYYRTIVDPVVLARCEALMSESEREQQRRFYFADDRLRYLVTRAMVRTVLSRYATVAPADWEFTRNTYGRPEIDARHNVPGLCFNVSHTTGLIALAVSTHDTVGVDVENLAKDPPPLEIAENFFAPVEVAELAALPEHRRLTRFFEYWTFKESYIKARGIGLSLPLDQFSFHFAEPRRVTLTIDAELCDDPTRWHFWQCRPASDYILALCAECVDGTVPSVAVHTITPTVTHQAVCVEWLKSSAQLLMT